MSGWGGFTDEELRRMKNAETDVQRPRPQGQGRGRGNAALKQASLQASRGPPARKPRVQSEAVNVDLPAGQRLSAQKSKPQTNRARTQDSNDISVKDTASEEKVSTEKTNEKAAPEIPVETTTEEAKPDKEAIELDDTEVAKIDMNNMEKFQQQQKQMEELNKQKRAFLATAIQQRRKKAVAEASKLNHLHKELDRLDDLLTEDVSKIRDRIETASRDYLDAQKRYERAEKEFIEAKIDLHQKEELKESLTEHLYTVIHHNEVRKSKKLAELMGQLDMEEAAELSALINMPEIPFMVPQASYIRGPKSPGLKPKADANKSEGIATGSEEKKEDAVENDKKDTTVENKSDSDKIEEQKDAKQVDKPQETKPETATDKTNVEKQTESGSTNIKQNGSVESQPSEKKDVGENNNKESGTGDNAKIPVAT